MTDERKATDILLSIENEVKTLSRAVSTVSLAQTLSLDKLNRVYNYIHKLELELAEAEKAAQTGSSQIGLPSGTPNTPIETSNQPIINIDTNPVGTRRTARVENPQPQVPQPMFVDRPEKQEEVQSEQSSERKVPVVQRITDQTGKDLFMADIRVVDSNDRVVHRMKTNAVGKWQAHLVPGVYDVHISKADPQTKIKIEAAQTITVPNSNSTVVLPVAAIKR